MTEPIDVSYNPQPKQRELHESPANEILFGGAAGPGKSHGLRMEGLGWCLRVPNLQVYLFRRTYPELVSNHIIKSWLEFPTQVAHYNKSEKYWHFQNNSMLHMCHCQYDKDVFIYQGAEIHLLLIDELTTFTKFIYDYLVGRVRCTLEIPNKYKHKLPGIVCASNPGNLGHGWVKEHWVDYAEPYELKEAPRDLENPEAPPLVRQYIPGLLSDNPILLRTDPGYVTRLNSLPEPWRTAYKDGRWDIFMGQMFLFSERHHVIAPRPIPEGAPIYFTFDWGFGAPYSAGWWWIDNDNRFYRFKELYGQLTGAPDNTGARETDEVIAAHINRIEEEEGVKGRVRHILSPDCWNKKPDYQGGGQGKSTAEVFQNHGITQLVKGDPNRKLKIRQMHERLRIPRRPDGTDGMPMLVVYNTCRDFIRTIPALTCDEHNVEDVDSKLEDHCFVGMTRLHTLERGLVPIAELVGTQGHVYGAVGAEPYWRPRRTRRQAEIVQVEFENGRRVRCTPDHRFMSADGEWRSIVDLYDEACYVDTCLKSSVTPSRNMADCGTTAAAAISSARAFGYIAGFMRMFTAVYQRAPTSTIVTMIQQTMSRITLNSRRALSIGLSMLSSGITAPGLRRCTTGLPSGMGLSGGTSGTGSNMSATADLLSWGLMSTSRASSAVRRLTDLSIGDSARTNVSSGRGSAVSVRSIRPAGREDVYCLTAPATNSFTIEGGFLVANCYDEAALLCMSRPLSLDLAALAEEQKLAERIAKEKELTAAERSAWDEKRALEKELGGNEGEWESLSIDEEGERI